jgi:hypothetical protein
LDNEELICALISEQARSRIADEQLERGRSRQCGINQVLQKDYNPLMPLWADRRSFTAKLRTQLEKT